MTTQSKTFSQIRRFAAQASLVAMVLAAGPVLAQTASRDASAPGAQYVAQAQTGRVLRGGVDGSETKGSPAAQVTTPSTPAAPVVASVSIVEKQVLRDFLNKKNYVGALKQTDLLLARVSTDAELHVIKGIALFAMGKYAEALASQDRAISLDPRNVEAILGRADAKYGLGRLAEIPADMEDALTRVPNSLPILNILAQANMRLGKMDAALAAAERAVTADPASHLGWNVRGLVHAKAGRLQQAVDDYNKSIEIAPKYGFAIANRGVALLRMGKIEQAEADLVAGARTYNIKYAAVHLQALQASRVFGAPQQQASR